MPISQKTHSQKQKPLEDIMYEHNVHTYLEWHAPGRPFKEHSFEYYFNIFLIMIAVEIILFLFGQYILMLVVFSLVFFTFSLSLVPPRNFYYTISSEGIRVEDHFFIWEELYDFFFIKHHGKDVLYVRTKAFFPGELNINIDGITTDEIKNTLLPYLPFREYVKPTFIEKSGDWLSKNFPLEKTAKQ